MSTPPQGPPNPAVSKEGDDDIFAVARDLLDRFAQVNPDRRCYLFSVPLRTLLERILGNLDEAEYSASLEEDSAEEFEIDEAWYPKGMRAIDLYSIAASDARVCYETTLRFDDSESSERLLRFVEYIQGRVYELRGKISPDDEEGSDSTDSTGLKVGASLDVRSSSPPVPFILTLPPELLGLIIIEVTKACPLSPWTFSQVNSYCREVTIGMPALWASIELSHDFSSGGVERVQMQLMHSKDCPLDVRLVGGSHGEPDPFRRFMEYLCQHAQRLRSLSCSVGLGSESLPILRTILSLDLPILETLEVEIFTFPVGQPVSSIPLNLPDSPAPFSHKLKRLSLHFLPFSDYPSLCSDHLVSLTIHHTTMGFADFLLAIRASPSLETLQIESTLLTNCPPLSDTFQSPLHQLRTLILIGIPIRYSRIIRRYLDTPSLQTLVFEQGPSYQEVYDETIPGEPHSWLFHIVTVGQLRRLDLKSCDVDPDSWNIIFLHMPTLESLKITSSYLTDDCLVSLINFQSEENDNQLLGPLSCGCPSLTELVLINEIRLTSAIVRRIIESRHDTGTTPIRAVRMQGWDGTKVSQQDVRAIREQVGEFVLGVFGAGESDDEEYDEADPESELESESDADSWYYEYVYESDGAAIEDPQVS